MNGRTNLILCKFIPRGHCIQDYTDEPILLFFDKINATSRERLGYSPLESCFMHNLTECIP